MKTVTKLVHGWYITGLIERQKFNRLRTWNITTWSDLKRKFLNWRATLFVTLGSSQATNYLSFIWFLLRVWCVYNKRYAILSIFMSVLDLYGWYGRLINATVNQFACYVLTVNFVWTAYISESTRLIFASWLLPKAEMVLSLTNKV